MNKSLVFQSSMLVLATGTGSKLVQYLHSGNKLVRKSKAVAEDTDINQEMLVGDTFLLPLPTNDCGWVDYFLSLDRWVGVVALPKAQIRTIPDALSRSGRSR